MSNRRGATPMDAMRSRQASKPLRGISRVFAWWSSGWLAGWLAVLASPSASAASTDAQSEWLAVEPPDWTLGHSPATQRSARDNHVATLRAALATPFARARIRSTIRFLGPRQALAHLELWSQQGVDRAAAQVLSAYAHEANGDPRAALFALQAALAHRRAWQSKVAAWQVLLAAGANDEETMATLLANHGAALSLATLREARALALRSTDLGNADQLTRFLASDRRASAADIEARANYVLQHGEASQALDLCRHAFKAALGLGSCAQVLAQADEPAAAQAALAEYLEHPLNRTPASIDAWVIAHQRDNTVGEFVTGAQALQANDFYLWLRVAQVQTQRQEASVPAWLRCWQLAPDDPRCSAGLLAALYRTSDAPDLAVLRPQGFAAPTALLHTSQEFAAELYRTQRPQAARHLIAWLSQAWPRHAQLQAQLIEVLDVHRELDLGLQVANRWRQSAPRSASAVIAQGEHLYQSGERSEALARWQELTTIVQPTHQGWAKLAEILGEHADVDRSLWPLAIQAMQRAIDYAPKAAYLHRLALYELARVEYEQAYRTWQRLLALPVRPDDQPLRDEARTRMVELLRRSGLPNRNELRNQALARAQSEVRHAVRNEAHSAAHFILELHRSENNVAAALPALHALHERFPGDEAGTLLLAQAMRQTGAFVQSEALLAGLPNRLDHATSTRVLNLAQRTRAETMIELGRYDQAIEVLVQNDDAPSMSALFSLAELCRKKGEKTCSRKALDAAVLHFSQSSAPHLQLAEALLVEAPEQALEHAKAVLLPQPKNDLDPRQAQRAVEIVLANASAEDHLALLDALLLSAAINHPARLAWIAALEHCMWRFPAASNAWLARLSADARDRLSTALIDVWQSDQLAPRERFAALAPRLLPQLDPVSLGRALARDAATSHEPALIRQRAERARAELIAMALQHHGEKVREVLQNHPTALRTPEIVRLLMADGLMKGAMLAPELLQRALSTPFDDANVALACLMISLDPGGYPKIPARTVIEAAQASATPTTQRLCLVAQRLQTRRDQVQVMALIGSSDPWQAAAAVHAIARAPVQASIRADFASALVQAYFTRQDRAATVIAHALAWPRPSASPPDSREPALTLLDFLQEWPQATEELAFARWLEMPAFSPAELQSLISAGKRDPGPVATALTACHEQGIAAVECRNVLNFLAPSPP